jgi:predicted O-methyltransferase YrrM
MPAAQALRTALKTLVKTVGDPLFWAVSKRELDALLAQHPSACGADILAVTRRYRGHGWYKRLGAYQVDAELARLADWAATCKPRHVIEIGTASGATLLLWARAATGKVISIDLPGGIHGGGYAAPRGRLLSRFAHDRPGVSMHLLRASSHDDSTKQRVRELLSGELVDVLFIDGDHRLEGVRRDYELWRDSVRPGGHIVFHDIVPHRRLNDCQVDVLWRALRAEHAERMQEIVAAEDQGWAGIGLLRV